MSETILPRLELKLRLFLLAFACLRRADPELAAGIPELPRIVAFRNMLIHGYATVNDQLVWAVVVSDLPHLLSMLDGLLEARGPK